MESNTFVEIFNDSDFMQMLSFEDESIVEIDRLTGIPKYGAIMGYKGVIFII